MDQDWGEGQVQRSTTPLVRFDRGQGRWVDLGIAIDSDRVWVPGTSRHMDFLLPGSARTHVTTAGRYIVTGRGDEEAIRLLGPAGRLAARLVPNLERHALTTADRGRLEGRVLDSASPANRVRFRAALPGLPIPDHWPAFGNLLGTDDELWVQEGREPADGVGRIWFVYSLDGAFRGAVKLPVGFQPTDAGPDFVLGLLNDDGTRTVAVEFRLGRP